MSRTILLADDSVTIQKVVELTFMDEDYELIAVSNGDEALERLEAVQPDLVIADVHMPGASGIEVCRRAKALLPEVPVLLLVGTFEPFDPAAAESAGADRHLKKPFDSQELLRLVEEMLASAPPATVADPAAAGGEEPEWSLEAEAPQDEPAEGAEGGEPLDEIDAEWAREAETEWEVGETPAADTGTTLADLVDDGAEDAADETWAGVQPETASPPSPPLDETPSEEIAAPEAGAPAGLSDGDVERIAHRVVELLGEQVVREIAWEVVPDLAEVAVKDRLRELESQVES